jgi:DNA-3-methyladenine glycosylase II
MTQADHPLAAAHLHAALDRLATADPELAAALLRHGYPPPRQRPQGFATLLQIMTAQQLSTHAAAAIFGRLEAAMAPAVTPTSFLALDEDALKAVGFGRRKIEHGRALAEAVQSGRLDLDALRFRADEHAVEAITALPGFGRWSAEIYLLFALGRADAFPASDLAIRIGMQRLRGLEARPGPDLTRDLARPWSPFRGCGAIFLWHLYGAATLGIPRCPAAG